MAPLILELETGGINNATPGTHSAECYVGPSDNLNSLEEKETKLSFL